MSDIISTWVVPIVVALVSSGSVSGLVLYFLKRHDKIEDIRKNNDRQAEGIAVLTEGFALLLEALHKRGLINGESEHIRKDLDAYLLKCAKNGLYSKKEQ